MGQIRKFKESPHWEDVRKILAEEVGFSGSQIHEIGEREGDSFDLVETSLALEEAFGSKLPKRRKS